MKIGIFYQMWYENTKAAYDSLYQLRKVYPSNEIILFITGLPVDDLNAYEENFLKIAKQEFSIQKVCHVHREDYVGNWYPEITVSDLVKYSDTILDYTLNSFHETTDFVIFASEDLYIFKQLPVNESCDICCNIRTWDDWMNVELKKKFDYEKVDNKILWFQHGHYLNIKKFKDKFTAENRKYIFNSLKEAYPTSQSIFSDYYTSIFATLACDSACRAEYLLELPSEITPETPEETFLRTGCYARHGYKLLYGKSL